MPAPIPKKLSTLPRESLEAETIFAVGGDEGDEERWSEDEEDDRDEDGEERKGLTVKKD